jgi:predicted transposase/invertase (TIGR01784 family)
MKQVASLQYGVIFKKAFGQVDVFKAFVKAVLGIDLEIDKVETEKSFRPAIGKVDSRFDLFAEDNKNRIIVDIQHWQAESHYDRFLHYHCAAILEQMPRGRKNYRPALKVFTIVVLTSSDRHEKDVLTIDFDPKDLQGKGIGEIPHQVIYLCPKFVNENTPEPYREWMNAIKDTLDGSVEECDYHNAMIQKIFASIEEDGITPTERYQMFEEYDRREIEEKLQAQAKLAGMLEGKLEEKQEIAKNLLAMGLAVEAIVKVTGLSNSAIEDLANPLSNDEEK